MQRIALLLALAVLFALPAHAQTATAHGALASWTAPTTFANGSSIPTGTALTYDVWRSTSATGPFVQVNPSPVTTTSYLDPVSDFPASPAGNYYYEVTAIDSGDMGVPTAAVEVTVPSGGFPQNPGTPTALTVTVQ